MGHPCPPLALGPRRHRRCSRWLPPCGSFNVRELFSYGEYPDLQLSLGISNAIITAEFCAVGCCQIARCRINRQATMLAARSKRLGSTASPVRVAPIRWTPGLPKPFYQNLSTYLLHEDFCNRLNNTTTYPSPRVLLQQGLGFRVPGIGASSPRILGPRHAPNIANIPKPSS